MWLFRLAERIRVRYTQIIGIYGHSLYRLIAVVCILGVFVGCCGTPISIDQKLETVGHDRRIEEKAANVKREPPCASQPKEELREL